MAARGTVFSGARARLSIEGVPVFYCTNVSYSEQIEQMPVQVLDRYEVAEHVPLGYTVTFNAQMVRTVGDPIKNRNGVTIFPSLEDILDAPEMTATIEDKQTQQTLANIERVKATQYNSSIAPRQGVFYDVEFVAIRIRDESEIV